MYTRKLMLNYQLQQRPDDFILSAEDVRELHPALYDKNAQQAAKMLRSLLTYRGEKRVGVTLDGERLYMIKHKNAEPPKPLSRVPYGTYPQLFNAFIKSGLHQKCMDSEELLHMSNRKLLITLRTRLRENAKYSNIGVCEIDGKIHLYRKDNSSCV